ncbi:MAG: hypothetical protein H0W85_01955 [Methylotenera sp.]|nr:hypothetical protein [Methylotenera sp.]
MKSILNQRHQARLAQSNIELHRLEAHAVVANMLRDANASKDLINKAKAQIAKWRDNQLCSYDFIQEWEVLLENPIKAAEILEDMTPASIRLRQNSPFAVYLKV